MQAVLAIPSLEMLRGYGGPTEVLMQRVAGVPLLVRVIATAKRAGMDSVLVMWPEGVDEGVLLSCAESRLLEGLRVKSLRRRDAFDPKSAAHWAAIAVHLDEQFLWLPWNWVTHKRALIGLPQASKRVSTWEFPVLLHKGRGNS